MMHARMYKVVNLWVTAHCMLCRTVQKIPGFHVFEKLSMSRFPLALEQKLIFFKILETSDPGKGLETALQRILANSS